MIVIIKFDNDYLWNFYTFALSNMVPKGRMAKIKLEFNFNNIVLNTTITVIENENKCYWD